MWILTQDKELVNADHVQLIRLTRDRGFLNAVIGMDTVAILQIPEGMDADEAAARFHDRFETALSLNQMLDAARVFDGLP